MGDHVIVGVLNQPPRKHISNEIIILEHTVRNGDRYNPLFLIQEYREKSCMIFLLARPYKLRRLGIGI